VAFDTNYDFYGVRLQARIQVTQGGAGRAFDPNDPTGGSVPDFIAFLYRSLDSIRVEEQLGTVSTISVTFSCPYDIALKVLASPYIQVTNVLHVRWGYSKTSAQMRPWLSGIIVAPPQVQLGPTTRISFTANGWGHALMRQSKKGSAPSTKNGTARDAFVEIMREYEFDPNNQLQDSKASTAWMAPLVPPIDRAVLSDYGVLRTIVDRTGNDFFVSGNLMVVAARDRVWTSSEARRAVFRLYGQIDPERMQYPMQNFELLNADAMFLPAAQTSVGSTYMNADTGEIEQVRSTPAEQVPLGGRKGPDISVAPATNIPKTQGLQKDSNPGTAATNPIPRKGNSSSSVYATHNSPGRDDSNKSTAQTEVNAKARVQAMYTQVAFEALGIPWMVPEIIVVLAGVGIFDGNYMTQTVEHNIGRNGYTMRVEALSRDSAQALIGSVQAQGGLFFIEPKRGAGTEAQA
jgi:hypothetical protein